MAEIITADRSLTVQSVDPRSGFCGETKTFHSLRPAVPLPPLDRPLSVAAYSFSLLPSPLPLNPALVDAATGVAISYPQFLSQVRSLATSLRAQLGLSKGDVAFVLSPSRLDVPVLYFSLLSIGAVIAAANPACTPTELSRQFNLANPCVAFATSSTASKLPSHATTVLLDSPQFRSLLTAAPAVASATAEVWQSDTAVIQFSSGTTGRVKAAALPHRSFIAMVAGFHAPRSRAPGRGPDVTLLVAPMFHSLGFFFSLKGVALGETLVLMNRGGFPDLLRAVERHRVTQMTAAPPVVVAMARSEEALRFDLATLERVFCGGAPVAVDSSERFLARFPSVDLCMAYGSTEAGGISRMIGHEECRRLRSVGRLSENVEAKIVDHVSGEVLSIYQQGELLLRGPAIMTGYIGDPESNASTFDSDGWMKTGDLCYFDRDGFLFIVDRLKELIKYKGYQVPPAELEHLLHSLPGIVDAAVIPYPHEEVGQIPMAFVVRKPGSNLSEAEVMDFVAKQVAPYKKIRRVTFIKSIPKSPAGKILRKELVTQALCGFASML